jgi:hypothetical protein
VTERRRNWRRHAGSALGLAAACCVASCGAKNIGNPAPPRVTTPASFPDQSSTIVVPVAVQLAELARGLNDATPRTLWQINQHEDRCVPAQRIKLFGNRVKVTPDLGCQIVGQVTRGTLKLSGKGQQLFITMPVNATIRVQKVGGIIKQKTATGAASVRAVARLDIARNWSPTAKVSIAYDWTDPPGIDFLGQRIKFTSKADAKLKGVIAGLERDLPKQLAKLRARDKLTDLWKQGFTTLSLNRENPPVWLRVTPRRLGFGGYRVVGQQIQMVLSAEALTQTFVGQQPAAPVLTPLPPPSRPGGPAGLRFFVPVLADFDQLEPVVSRTLVKLAKKGISLPKVGAVDAEFGKVTIYATDGGKLAVGIETDVKARDHPMLRAKGVVWLSALPYNDANSQLVKVRDLAIAGNTDSNVANLLFGLFQDPEVLANVSQALTHDFAGDYDKVMVKVRKAIAAHREGDFVFGAKIGKISNGAIQVTGEGLFLPVSAEGTASISYRPR